MTSRQTTAAAGRRHGNGMFDRHHRAQTTAREFDAMLSLHQLDKRYGTVIALDGVSLELQRGEVFGLLGPNGAGKSTAVHLIVGLLTPDGGRIDIAGRGAPQQAGARAAVGLAPQTLALYAEMTARENLRFFGALHGLRGTALTARVDRCLEFVQLSDRAGHRVKTFSGGMQRRLNLAVALVHDPPLLLLDEPTVGVDPQSRHAILENIARLKAEGRTILYTTHYMEEAQRLCDRVGILDRGRLLALDTVPALIAAHGGLSILQAEQLGDTLRIETADPLAEIVRLQKQGPLDRFSVERPTLEAVFLALTGRALRD